MSVNSAYHMTNSHAYDSAFMTYTASASSYAAERIVNLLVSELNPKSVLDIGCASGTWLAAWQRAGINDFFGIDGDYVKRSELLIDQSKFSAIDISKPFQLGRKYDLVQCLEVAEHIASSSADTLMDSIVAHAERFVLFSAAPPGQGGEYHVNEQTYDYWRALLGKRGFEAFDFVRPAIREDKHVSYWYRYNTLLYVRREYIASLPRAIKKTGIMTEGNVSDVSPLLFQLRKATVRLMPRAVQNALARFKARLFPSGRL